jgi:hypothetical protein
MEVVRVEVVHCAAPCGPEEGMACLLRILSSLSVILTERENNRQREPREIRARPQRTSR